MDAVGKIIAGVLSVAVYMIFSLSCMRDRQESAIQSYVQDRTSCFADTVRKAGYLNEKMYENYLTELGEMDYLFEINFEHGHRRLETELGDYYVYFENTYEEEIIGEIYSEKGKYSLKKEDYFAVTVQSKKKGKIPFLNNVTGIYARAGGFVTSSGEDYE